MKNPNPQLAAVSLTDASTELHGLTPERFRSFIRLWAVPHVRAGRRILVLSRDWEAAVAANASRAVEPESVDAVLASLGLVRSA